MSVCTSLKGGNLVMIPDKNSEKTAWMRGLPACCCSESCCSFWKNMINKESMANWTPGLEWWSPACSISIEKQWEGKKASVRAVASSEERSGSGALRDRRWTKEMLSNHSWEGWGRSEERR